MPGLQKCGVADACPHYGGSVTGETLSIDAERCNNWYCCDGKCPLAPWKLRETLYKVYVGDAGANRCGIGSALNKLFTREEVLDVVEKAIPPFKSKGESESVLAKPWTGWASPRWKDVDF